MAFSGMLSKRRNQSNRPVTPGKFEKSPFTDIYSLLTRLNGVSGEYSSCRRASPEAWTGAAVSAVRHTITPLPAAAEFVVAAGLFTSFNTCEDRRR
jgi:hypothetical protein